MSIVDTARERFGVCGGKVLVGLSGGKESLVTLDLAVAAGLHVECFHMYLVRGMRCVQGPLDRVRARYGVKIHAVPHWLLSRRFKMGMLRPAVDGAEKTRLIHQKDLEGYLKSRTGIGWIAYGHRAQESLVRNAMLKKIEGIDVRTGRLYPIWDWKRADVFAYLRTRKIPPPIALGARKDQSGVSLQSEFLVWLRDRYPDDFQRILKVFPYAEAQCFKWELTEGGRGPLSKRRRVEVPKVPNGTGPPKQASGG